MRGVRKLVTAILLASSALAVPTAYADNAENAGRRCGFVTNNDTTGVVEQDENIQFGAIRGGVWVAADVLDDDSPGPSHFGGDVNITMHCWIQVNSSSPGHAPIAGAHCDFTGVNVVYGGACQISYTAGITDNVYMCMWIEMTHGTNRDDYWEDEYPDVPGIQCPLAISASTPPSSEVGCVANAVHSGAALAVSMDCSGDGHDRGHYDMVLSNVTCSGGNGTISGTTDGESVSGTHSTTQSNGTIVVSGSFFSINHWHNLAIALAGASCPGAFTGGGAVAFV